MGGAGLFLAIVSGLLIFGVIVDVLDDRADREERQSNERCKKELDRYP